MWISKLNVQNCRIITHAELELSPTMNCFVGDNASGKSSLLEALSILARGRSFRTSRIQEVIHKGASNLTVSAKLSTDTGHHYPIGINKSTQQTQIRINHADVKQQAELSSHLPLTIIHPNSVELLTGSPQLRRAFIDWIAFYTIPEFNTAWRYYQRALKQRNVCLRDPKQRFALAQWTIQLIQWIPTLQRYRLQAVDNLKRELQNVTDLFTNTGYPQLQLSTGYPQDVAVDNLECLQQFIHSKREAELQQGFTLYGAHRVDLHITLDNVSAVRIASRGQLKLLAVGLLLARAKAVQPSHSLTPYGLLAIDDLASELDEQNQQALYNTLHTTRQQLIMTSTRHDAISAEFMNARVFHVKRGQITLA